VGYAKPNAQGPRLLLNVGIQAAIAQRLRDKAMTTDEVLTRLADQARSDIGVFFKIAERWTENPAPSEEVVDESIEFDDKGFQHTQYKVRAVVLDVDKLLDPHYSHLVKKFADTPRNGLTIELHDAQSALELIGRNQGLFRDKVELSGPDGAPLVIAIGGLDPHKDI
jgi:phage terminase small subunit